MAVRTRRRRTRRRNAPTLWQIPDERWNRIDLLYYQRLIEAGQA
jgi:hypothetical protein